MIGAAACEAIALFRELALTLRQLYGAPVREVEALLRDFDDERAPGRPEGNARPRSALEAVLP